MAGVSGRHVAPLFHRWLIPEQLGGRAEKRGRREPSQQRAELRDAGREGQVLALQSLVQSCGVDWAGVPGAAGPRYLWSPLVPTFCSEGPLVQGAGPRLGGRQCPRLVIRVLRPLCGL